MEKAPDASQNKCKSLWIEITLLYSSKYPHKYIIFEILCSTNGQKPAQEETRFQSQEQAKTNTRDTQFLIILEKEYIKC